MYASLLNDRFHPRIHYANRLACRPGDTFGPRKIDDYQFIFVQRGTGELRIGGQTYRAVPGSLFHYGPGEPHRIRASGNDPFVLFGVHYTPGGDTDRPSTRPNRIETLAPDFFERYDPSAEHASFETVFPAYLQPGMWPLPYFESLADEFAADRYQGPALMSGILTQFIVVLLRWIQDNPPYGSTLDRHLANIREQLEKQAEASFDPLWLERWTPYSADYVSRLFRDRFGDTPHAYHASRKALAAKQLLEGTSLSVTDIAERLQFGSIHYFCKWFKRMTGESPSSYRKRRYWL